MYYGVHYDECEGHETEFDFVQLESDQCGFDEDLVHADFDDESDDAPIFMLWKEKKNPIERHPVWFDHFDDTDNSHAINYVELGEDYNIYMDLHSLEDKCRKKQPIVGWVKTGYTDQIPSWLLK